MEFSWWAALYAKLGAAYPYASLVAVMLLGAIVAGGCWSLMAANYRDQKAAMDAAREHDAELEARLRGIEEGQKKEAQRQAEIDAKAERERDRRQGLKVAINSIVKDGNEIEAALFAKRAGAETRQDRWVSDTLAELRRLELVECAAEFEYPERSTQMSYDGLTYAQSSRVTDVRDRIRALRRCFIQLGG